MLSSPEVYYFGLIVEELYSWHRLQFPRSRLFYLGSAELPHSNYLLQVSPLYIRHSSSIPKSMYFNIRGGGVPVVLKPWADFAES